MDAGGPGQFDAQKAAFADAVARARQIAAKINQPGQGGDTGPLKRPFDSDGQALGNPNKPAPDQPRSSAAQAAIEAAQRINQQLGKGAPKSPPDVNQVLQKPGPNAGLGMVVTEEYRVPDKMVGLIIGKGGEQITRLQAETGCKIQIAPDSGGMPDRPCQLTGSSASIAACKQQMNDIIARGQGGGGGGMPPQGNMGGMYGDGMQTVVEMCIPGNKVGLIIGKGGETIKVLQEKAGVKMVMIQDSNIPSAAEKPLRISGDPQKCQRAKEMIMDLLAEKEMESMGRGGGFNDYNGGGGSGSQDIQVPRSAVGIVIGKGGDMIKKIQNDTGAKVQFKPDDGRSDSRVCTVSGAPDKANAAIQMIQRLLPDEEGGFPFQHGGMGRGYGRGRGGPGPGQGGGFGPGGGRGRGGPGGFNDENFFPVPADKCGLVIGKGGETIRQINQQSGAHVELQRNPGPNPNEKVFVVRGNPQQVQQAISMIAEKAGVPVGPGGPGGPGPGPMGGPGGGPGGYGDQFGGNGGPGPGDQGQFGGPGGPNEGSGGYGDHYGQSGGGQPPQQQYGGPQGGQGGWGGGGWGGNNYGGPQGAPGYQQPQPQQSGDPNQSKQAQDNAAAWAAYYAQFYNQTPYAQYGQQQPQQQQPQVQQQQPAPNQSSAINPQTGQPDYSQAWAEYYRQQGMFTQAQMVLQQAAAMQAGAGSHQPTQPPQ